MDMTKKTFQSIIYLEKGNYVMKMATKEKAICDSLCKKKVVKKIKVLKNLSFVDKRIAEDEFSIFDFKPMERLTFYMARSVWNY